MYSEDVISSNDMLSIHDGATAFDELIVNYTDRLMCAQHSHIHIYTRKLLGIGADSIVFVNVDHLNASFVYVQESVSFGLIHRWFLLSCCYIDFFVYASARGEEGGVGKREWDAQQNKIVASTFRAYGFSDVRVPYINTWNSRLPSLWTHFNWMTRVNTHNDIIFL